MSKGVWRMEIIDVQVDEARKLAAIQHSVNARYVGKPADLRYIMAMRDEIRTRCAEAGFVVEFDSDGQPCIVGRTDKRLERTLAEQGPDIERKAWDSRKVSSSELSDEGVDPTLLG